MIHIYIYILYIHMGLPENWVYSHQNWNSFKCGKWWQPSRVLDSWIIGWRIGIVCRNCFRMLIPIWGFPKIWVPENGCFIMAWRHGFFHGWMGVAGSPTLMDTSISQRKPRFWRRCWIWMASGGPWLGWPLSRAWYIKGFSWDYKRV